MRMEVKNIWPNQKNTRIKKIRNLDFNMPTGGLTHQQVSEVREWVSSMSDIAEADEIELKRL